MFFWNSLAFFNCPMDIGNLISGSSAFSKSLFFFGGWGGFEKNVLECPKSDALRTSRRRNYFSTAASSGIAAILWSNNGT